MTRVTLGCFVSGVLAVLVLGCASSGAASPPPTYPGAYYDGGRVYWIGGRWYTQRSGSWFYYGTEPEALRRYRSQWHYAPSRHDAPPRRRGPAIYRPSRQVAPPEVESAAPWAERAATIESRAIEAWRASGSAASL